MASINVTPIDRASRLPLYYQLKQWLVEQIENGRWQPGDMLPTEQQLQEENELSRTTVRQAFRELEQDGLVIRYRGRGTFVAKPKVVHSPEPLSSLTNYLLQQGMQSGWKLLTAESVSSPPDVAARLHVEPDTQIYCLRRLRLANDEPIGYHVTYVSPDFLDAIDEAALTEGGSLRYLRRKNHLDGSHADRTLEAIPANEIVADLLDVDEGTPMLLIRRLVVSQDGRPIEDFRGIYRGDRFQYHINSLGLSIRPMSGFSSGKG